jgi:hypothetical protein
MEIVQLELTPSSSFSFFLMSEPWLWSGENLGEPVLSLSSLGLLQSGM